MMLATFGTMQISAYGVAQTYFGMSALFCLGMVPAFTTVIGQYMGIGDEEGAEYYIKKLLRLTYLGGFIWDFVWIILTPVLMNFYSISVEGKILVIIMVIIHNVFDAVINPYAFSLTGGLRAAGDVQFTMIAAIFGSVVCRVTFAYFFGVILKWGAIGITLAMVADWFVKGGLIIIRYYTGKWKGHKVI
jgi:Na+-driven multidrug efflux pump